MARDQGVLSTIHRPPPWAYWPPKKVFTGRAVASHFPETRTLLHGHTYPHTSTCECTERSTHTHMCTCAHTHWHTPSKSQHTGRWHRLNMQRENSRRGIFLTGILSCPSNFFSWTKGKEPTTSPLPLFSQVPLTTLGPLLFRPSQPLSWGSDCLGLANYSINDNHLFLHPGGRKNHWTQPRIMKLECSKY